MNTTEMNTTEEPIDTTSRFPWCGAIATIALVSVMVGLSVWFWPQLADGVISTQRDGSDMVIPGWLVAGFAPALAMLVGAVLFAAQPVRIRTASALDVPLWRTNRVNRRATTIAMALTCLVLFGVHVLVLSLTGGAGLEFGLSVLASCLGLMLIVLGNAMPKLAPLSDQQRAYFPRRSHEFIHGYREGAHRAMRRLAKPTIALGILTCGLAFIWPYVAMAIPMLSAVSLLIPGVTGLVNGTTRQQRTHGT